MHLEIISVGKPKSSWLQEGVEHYRKLCSRYAQVELRRVRESSGSKGAELVRTEESERLKAAINANALTILLDEHGRKLDSEGLAGYLEKSKLKHSHVQLLIGGAYGVTDVLRSVVDETLSLSSLTLPHDLTLLLLLEQLFRAMSITAGSKYHK